MSDPAHFMKHLASTIDYDEAAMLAMHNNRHVLTNTNAITGPLYVLYRANFGLDHQSAILAPTYKEALAILKNLVDICAILPDHLRPNFTDKNKGRVEFENGSKIMATSCTSDSTQGRALNMIYIDSFARVPWDVAELFFLEKFPCITCGEYTKLIINHGKTFYDKLWNDQTSMFVKV